MHHLMIAVALLALVVLDVTFVRFSDTASAALTFAVLSYTILLLLSASAGTFVDEPEDSATFLGPILGAGPQGLLTRVLLATSIPVALLLILAFIPDLDDPVVPSETIQLGSTFAVFWLLMALALVGAVLGFLWPRTGAFEAVVAGGLVVLAQGLLSWAKVEASREAIELALYTWMVWVSICLVGAWVGLTLRQISDFHLYQPGSNQSGVEESSDIESAPASQGGEAAGADQEGPD